MNNDLLRGYKSFFLSLLKAQSLAKNILKKEVDYVTNNKLKDSLAFFICAFDRTNKSYLLSFKINDLEALSEYIILPKKDNEIIKLTKEGEKLKEHLLGKLEKHSAMLQFNGLKPTEVAKLATSLKRFDQFWSWILDLSSKYNSN
jgi:hypothetical protein